MAVAQKKVGIVLIQSPAKKKHQCRSPLLQAKKGWQSWGHRASLQTTHLQILNHASAHGTLQAIVIGVGDPVAAGTFARFVRSGHLLLHGLVGGG